MKKIKKALIGAGFIGLVFAVWSCAGSKTAIFREQNDYETKTYKGADLLGRRMTIERQGNNPIYGIYYPCQSTGKAGTPLVINIHGGAFVKGASDDLDAQSKRISQDWGTSVYNLDYTLLPMHKFFTGDKEIQYQVDELSDVIRYFKKNADKHNIDPGKIILIGYSSGGYLALASVLDLAEENQSVWGQIICYGFIKDGKERYQALPQSAKKLTNTLFVFTERADAISETTRPYYDMLVQNGVKVSKLEYDKARHGFMEENNPEDKNNPQASYVREAENDIKKWIQNLK